MQHIQVSQHHPSQHCSIFQVLQLIPVLHNPSLIPVLPVQAQAPLCWDQSLRLGTHWSDFRRGKVCLGPFCQRFWGRSLFAGFFLCLQRLQPRDDPAGTTMEKIQVIPAHKCFIPIPKTPQVSWKAPRKISTGIYAFKLSSFCPRTGGGE